MNMKNRFINLPPAQWSFTRSHPGQSGICDEDGTFSTQNTGLKVSALPKHTLIFQSQFQRKSESGVGKLCKWSIRNSLSAFLLHACLLLVNLNSEPNYVETCMATVQVA
jgi:hypothetical protein